MTAVTQDICTDDWNDAIDAAVNMVAIHRSKDVQPIIDDLLTLKRATPPADMEGLRALFDDHYWDSLTHVKDIVMLHVDAVLKLFGAPTARSSPAADMEGAVEAAARAICGTDCKLSGVRGAVCRRGEPCQATSDQLFLTSIWTDAEAAIASITALQRGAPTPEQLASAIFCAGHSPTNPCERGCFCDDHYVSVLELISRPVLADQRTETK